MKKLMIAAAAAAMIGGAQAVTVIPCVACGDDPVTPGPEDTTTAAFYNVQFKLNTLQTKKLTCKNVCEDCEDDVTTYYETGKRTIDGILFKCSKCDDTIDWQLCLWEKATKLQLTADLVWAKEEYSTNYWYQISGTVRIYEEEGVTYNLYKEQARTRYNGGAPWGEWADTGNTQVDVEQPNGTSQTTRQTRWEFVSFDHIDYSGIPFATASFADKKFGDTYKSEKAAQDDEANVGANIEAMTMADIQKLLGAKYPKAKGMEIASYSYVIAYQEKYDENGGWTSEPADIEFYRFGKKAEKAAAEFAVTGAQGFDPDAADGTGWTYTFNAIATGFGTYDAKNKVVKSVSGNFVGSYTCIPGGEDCSHPGQYFDICEDFESWCDDGTEADYIPAYGTWTLKYNAGLMKKSMRQIVPNFYTIED